MTLFVDSRKRIDRAVLHAKAFCAEWTSLLEDAGCRVVTEKEDDWTWTAHAIFSKSLDNDLALELGEFFYQLRAALDGAIWNAVTICEGTEPTSNINRLEFPIYVDLPGRSGKDKFEKSAVIKHNFPQDLWKWLETIQPYAASKASDDPDLGLGFLLEVLHDCARKDRHRRLRVVGACPEDLEYVFSFSSPARITFKESIRANFFENETKFFRFGLESNDGLPIENAVLETAITVNISVDDIPIVEGGNVADELERFLAGVRYIINRFEETFERLSELKGT